MPSYEVRPLLLHHVLVMLSPDFLSAPLSHPVHLHGVPDLAVATLPKSPRTSH